MNGSETYVSMLVAAMYSPTPNGLPLRMDARDVGSCADQQDAVEGADIGTPTGQEPIAGRERLLQARKRLLLRTGPHGDDRYVIVHSGFSCVLTPTIRN